LIAAEEETSPAVGGTRGEFIHKSSGSRAGIRLFSRSLQRRISSDVKYLDLDGRLWQDQVGSG
jgi:hypothetical protein